MKKLKIYIASSWKNQHAVELMTTMIRKEGHEVLSFVENNFEEGYGPDSKLPFEQWIHSENARNAFLYDTKAAMSCDMVIYISCSGKDAAAEVGMAYAKGIPIIGLYAKGEDFGLMRKMMYMWCNRYPDVICQIQEYAQKLSLEKEAINVENPVC